MSALPLETPSYVGISSRTKTLVMAATILGLFTTTLNSSIINTAIPRLVGSLGHFELLPWVFTSFMLTSTAAMPIVGKLSDIYGRKPFFVGSLALFLAGSILAGSAQTMYEFIAYRAIQGLGSGVVLTLGFVIIGDLFEPKDRVRWTGVLSSGFSLASVLGPLAGGTLTDHLGWRWVFFINLPLGIFVLGLILVAMPPIKPGGQSGTLDRMAIPLILMTVVSMLLAFTLAGKDHPWLSPQIISLFGASLFSAVILLWVESRAEDPMLPISLFRDPVFVVAATINLLIGLSVFGCLSWLRQSTY